MENLEKLSLEELIREKEELDKSREDLIKQIEVARHEVLLQKQKKAAEKIEALTDEQKKFILSMMTHDRTSCDDDHVHNGRWTSGSGDGFRCRKCMLMEMFDGEHEGIYDFELSVDIFKVTA